MRKLVLGALTGCLLAAAVPAAQARTDFSRRVLEDPGVLDGCTLVAVEDPTPNANFGGEDHFVAVLVMAYVPIVGTFTPAPTCRVKIDGVTVPGTTFGPTFSGPGYALAANVIGFTADESQIVEVCVANVMTPNCDTVTTIGVPPQEVLDFLDTTVFPVVDPTLCDLLWRVPSLANIVDIDPWGDITLFNSTKIYDCPPYGS